MEGKNKAIVYIDGNFLSNILYLTKWAVSTHGQSPRGFQEAHWVMKL